MGSHLAAMWLNLPAGNLQPAGIAFQNAPGNIEFFRIRVICVQFRILFLLLETHIKAHSHARTRCSGELAV